MTRNQKQGHPARDNPTAREIERLTTRSVQLVKEMISDPKFSAEDLLTAKAVSVGLLTLYARSQNKPTPYEIHNWKGGKPRNHRVS